MARVPKSIWKDPEFTSMTTGAQLLWFALVSSPAGQRKYNRAKIMGFINLTKAQMKRAEREIRSRPTYAGAFQAARYRPAIPRRVRVAVYERDGHACLHCGAVEGLSLDHVIPYSRGGPDTIENLQTLCRPCNSRKGARV